MATHFSPEALRFLRGLKRNNDREWFEKRKALYERELKAPILALATEVNEAMLDFAPHHVRDPRKAVMRIYRDVRFSTDKSPYKTQVAAWWSRAGLEKTSGGGFYFHISPAEVTIAAGVYMPERDQLLAIRRHLVEHHQDLRKLLADKKLRASMQEFDGRKLSRPPKGFPAGDPKIDAAMDLLLCRQWGLSATLPVDTATSPKLAKEIIARFRAAAPVVAFLNAPLVQNIPRKVVQPAF